MQWQQQCQTSMLGIYGIAVVGITNTITVSSVVESEHYYPEYFDGYAPDDTFESIVQSDDWGASTEEDE